MLTGSLKVREPRATASECYQGQVRRASGYDRESHVVMLKPDPDEFVRHTADIIVLFEITDDTCWPDAGFELEVSGEPYLAHLTSNTMLERALTGSLPYAC